MTAKSQKRAEEALEAWNRGGQSEPLATVVARAIERALEDAARTAESDSRDVFLAGDIARDIRAMK